MLTECNTPPRPKANTVPNKKEAEASPPDSDLALAVHEGIVILRNAVDAAQSAGLNVELVWNPQLGEVEGATIRRSRE